MTPPGTPVDQTDEPRTAQPLHSTPITGTSPLLRASPPARPTSVLDPSRAQPACGHSLSPPHRGSHIRTRLHTFHARAADRTHVAYMPDTTWPVNGTPARPITKPPKTPLSMPPQDH